ncbi:hypothetical protein OF83DRAFT_340843 [Amylostereum chailletii]|nr:hypothetical protein OF83DRAFT_340843 [Amylostereum chailletii]
MRSISALRSLLWSPRKAGSVHVGTNRSEDCPTPCWKTCDAGTYLATLPLTSHAPDGVGTRWDRSLQPERLSSGKVSHGDEDRRLGPGPPRECYVRLPLRLIPREVVESSTARFEFCPLLRRGGLYVCRLGNDRVGISVLATRWRRNGVAEEVVGTFITFTFQLSSGMQWGPSINKKSACGIRVFFCTRVSRQLRRVCLWLACCSDL